MWKGGGGLTPAGRVVALVSGVWSGFFLLFTSLMLLEKRLDGRFGGVAAYEQYKLEVPVLVPDLLTFFTAPGPAWIDGGSGDGDNDNDVGFIERDVAAFHHHAPEQSGKLTKKRQ